MARERMAKFRKYVHFELRTGHIFHQIQHRQNVHHHGISLAPRYLGSSPPDEDVAYTMTSATPRNAEEKIPHQNWM